MSDFKEDVLTYARSFLGTPYVYGGNNPLTGWDCSGFMCFVMRKAGWVGPHEDLSCQSLYERFKKLGTSFPVASLIFPRGALVFYGSNLASIGHVALLVDNGKSVIECGGGNETTDSVERAKKLGACVRETAFRFRTDIVAVILPPYPA